MENSVKPSLNHQIVSDFITGKNIIEIERNYKLDASYITLVLYQEGIHYTRQDEFKAHMKNESNNQALS